eukprot:3832792-Amphidinium_carterae.1
MTGHPWLLQGWEDHIRDASPDDFLVRVPIKGDAFVSEHQLDYRVWSLAARAVMQKLRIPCRRGRDIVLHDNALFHGHAQLFWHEHSARCSLVSWLVAMGHTRDESLRFVGRWSAGTADVYVRTARKQVGEMQQKLVKEVQLSGTASLGEKLLLLEFARWLVASQVSADQVEITVAALRTASACIPRDCHVQSSDDETRSGCENSSPDLSDILLDDDTETAVPMGTYVLSQTKRVHRVGNCWRVPYVDYQVKAIIAEEDLHLHTLFCKQCQLGVIADTASSSDEASV